MGLAKAYLSIGSNLGDKIGVCLSAVKELNSYCNIAVISSSSLYETEAVGYTNQPSFINMAVKIQTDLSPEALLEKIKEMEKRLGRKKTFRWGPRAIDIDIIFYDDKVISSSILKIPHPCMYERAFVLYPLNELDREVKDPVTGMSVAHLIKKLHHTGKIRKLPSRRGIE